MLSEHTYVGFPRDKQNENMKKPHLLAIWLDGFRTDYLRKDWTPYLYQLANNSITGEYRPPLAFTGIGVSILTGVNPLKHRIWTEFIYEPNRSPYKWTATMAKLAKFVDVTTDHAGDKAKLARIGTAHLIFKLSNHISHSTYTPIAHMVPLSILPFFNVTISKDIFQEDFLPFMTLPEIMKRFLIPFRILSESRMKDPQIIEEAFRINRNDRLSIIQLGHLDHVGHTCGPNSGSISEALSKMDNLICAMVKKYEEFFNLDIFIFSDHGMVNVKRTVDPLRDLRNAKIKTNEYLAFFDSTLARFWAFTKNAEERLLTHLGETCGGKILSREDYKQYQIPSERRYGDIIWLAEPGTLILPNYYQGSSMNFGMHGYSPEAWEQCSPFIIRSSGRNARSVEHKATPMDIYATILDLLQLPIPSNTEGQSLLFVR